MRPNISPLPRKDQFDEFLNISQKTMSQTVTTQQYNKPNISQKM